MSAATIPQVEPIKVLAMIIQEEMSLPDGSIMLSLENWKIPNNVGLYVALTYGPDTVVGSANYNGNDASGNYVEVQAVAMLHQVEVDIMSFDSSARTRKEEVIQAIQSVYAQALMEKYQMRVLAIPTAFSSVPSLEPSKQLNRFRIAVDINALHVRTKPTAYYDTLQEVELTENS